ncbi:hypothetical protein ACHQM5_026012 [Ranunculus cassubicifolius]
MQSLAGRRGGTLPPKKSCMPSTITLRMKHFVDSAQVVEEVVDECTHYQDCRYISATETAFWILKLPILDYACDELRQHFEEMQAKLNCEQDEIFN